MAQLCKIMETIFLCVEMTFEQKTLKNLKTAPEEREKHKHLMAYSSDHLHIIANLGSENIFLISVCNFRYHTCMFRYCV